MGYTSPRKGLQGPVSVPNVHSQLLYILNIIIVHHPVSEKEPKKAPGVEAQVFPSQSLASPLPLLEHKMSTLGMAMASQNMFASSPQLS